MNKRLNANVAGLGHARDVVDTEVGEPWATAVDDPETDEDAEPVSSHGGDAAADERDSTDEVE